MYFEFYIEKQLLIIVIPLLAIQKQILLFVAVTQVYYKKYGAA